MNLYFQSLRAIDLSRESLDTATSIHATKQGENYFLHGIGKPSGECNRQAAAEALRKDGFLQIHMI